LRIMALVKVTSASIRWLASTTLRVDGLLVGRCAVIRQRLRAVLAYCFRPSGRKSPQSPVQPPGDREWADMWFRWFEAVAESINHPAVCLLLLNAHPGSINPRRANKRESLDFLQSWTRIRKS
jgi:hypothetical protein